VFTSFAYGARSACIESGAAAEFIDEIREKSIQENDGCTHNVWGRFRFNWARKLLEDGTSAPAVPIEKTGHAPMPPLSYGQPVQGEDPGVGKYHAKHFYYSKEAAQAWMSWRQEERRRIGVTLQPDIPCWGDDVQ